MVIDSLELLPENMPQTAINENEQQATLNLLLVAHFRLIIV